MVLGNLLTLMGEAFRGTDVPLFRNGQHDDAGGTTASHFVLPVTGFALAASRADTALPVTVVPMKSVPETNADPGSVWPPSHPRQHHHRQNPHQNDSERRQRGVLIGAACGLCIEMGGQCFEIQRPQQQRRR